MRDPLDYLDAVGFRVELCERSRWRWSSDRARRLLEGLHAHDLIGI